MNATITHTMSNKKTIRLCMQCNLRVDDYGFPDPRFYSSRFLQHYYGIPEKDRCNHVRPVTPQVSPSEERYKKALHAALDLINEALYG